MADLNPMRRDDDTVPDAYVLPDAGERLLAASTHAAAPGVIAQVDDPELARLQIEQTRARMSDTIDQIEGALLRKKADLQERMDVMAPVRRTARENPYPVIGGVFLAGLILGLLTGGDDEEDEARPAVRRFAADFDRERAHGTHWEERARTWERRARRLMDVASEQERELLEMRGESVELPRRRRRLFGRGRGRDAGTSWGVDGYVDTDTDLEVEERDRSVRGGNGAGYNGMPLHDADSRPPRGEFGGYGRDPLPAPI